MNRSAEGFTSKGRDQGSRGQCTLSATVSVEQTKSPFNCDYVAAESSGNEMVCPNSVLGAWHLSVAPVCPAQRLAEQATVSLKSAISAIASIG